MALDQSLEAQNLASSTRSERAGAMGRTEPEGTGENRIQLYGSEKQQKLCCFVGLRKRNLRVEMNSRGGELENWRWVEDVGRSLGKGRGRRQEPKE